MLSNINQSSVCLIFCNSTFLFEKFADIFKMLGTSQAFVWMDDTQNSGPKKRLGEALGRNSMIGKLWKNSGHGQFLRVRLMLPVLT